ncbi:hypothetical protein FS749_005350 [Ceratobasidium sp. UAMH 11750]|nr:hypothetical protein FS749_005350 [Ceratobasidium sp. UAMH 11750]
MAEFRRPNHHPQQLTCAQFTFTPTTMPSISKNFIVTSTVADEDDLWGTKGIYIEDASPSMEVSWSRLPLGMSPPPGLPIPLHLLSASSPKLAGARPNAKPKGPRPQPPRHITESPELPTTHSSNHHEPSTPTLHPPHKARGLYGARPRLPTHRPSRYISEYTCDGDRFAHLAPFRDQQTLVVDQHACVNLATMGLERFNMGDEDDYMDLEEEAEFFRGLDAVMQPPSLGSVQLSFVTSGLRGALANFRTRFGPGSGGAREGSKESGVETLVEGGYVDVERDEVCFG